MDMHEQLNNYLHEVGVEVKIKRNTTYERKDFPAGSRHYDVIVSNQFGDSFRTVYSQGPATKEEPSILSVVYSIVIGLDCGELSFKEFCADIGYDEDSREDYKLFMDVKALNTDVYSVLGDDIVRRIGVIVQDY